MKIRIVYKGIDSQPVLEDFINQRIAKIEKILEDQRTPVTIDLILEPTKIHAHNEVKMIVSSPDYDLFASHEGPDLYKEIDCVTDKMIRELRRAKEKIVSESKKGDSY